MEEKDVLLQEKKGNIGIITFNRPEQRNALSVELLGKFSMALAKWSKDETIRAVIITGAGSKAFSSGFDLFNIPENLSPEIKKIIASNNPIKNALNSLKHFPYPTIAMMNGATFGAALHIAFCCDIRIGVDDIAVGMPVGKLGLVYNTEGIIQFIKILGIAKARELFFTARTYKGNEVKEMGIVNYLAPREKLLSTTLCIAEQIAINAPLSLKGVKKIINMFEPSWSLNASDLNKAEEIVAAARSSKDFKEGKKAFKEKRKPVFMGF